MKRAILLLTGFLAAAVAGTLAQGGATGAIVGKVQDTSGAMVASAEIRIVNQSTGVLARRLASDDRGSFSALLLPIGTYEVVVRGGSFAEARISGVSVRVTETTSLTVTLHPTQIKETVEVQSVVAPVDMSSATTGQTIESDAIDALPLPTRNVQQMLALSTGTSTDLTGAGQLGRGDVRMNVNGQREGNNNFLVEGISASDYNLGELTNTPLPSPEALGEFKVQTSLYDATQGRAGGGNINAILRSGTKRFHGSLFEYFRNDVLNANDFFFNRRGQPRPSVKQNIFGGSLGGPLGNEGRYGFFFLNYQGARQRSGLSPGTYIVTSIPVLPADRSDTSLLETFFPGQTGVQIDPVVSKLLNAKTGQFGGIDGGFLFPTVPGTPGFDPNSGYVNTGPLVLSRPGKFRDDQVTANWDRSFNDGKDLLTERFFLSNFSSFLPFGASGLASAFGAAISPTDLGFPISLPVRDRFVVLTETHVFSPRLINEVRFGWVHIANDINNLQVLGLDDLGISRPNSNVDTNIYRFQFAQGGFQMGPTPAANQSQQQNNFTVLDTVSYSRGRHQLRFGGQVDRINLDKNFPQLFNGLVVFAPIFPPPGDTTDVCALSPFGFCDDFQNFLRGFPVVSGSGSGVTTHEYRINAFAGFVQDDFRAAPNLTLNLGLRWELDGAVSDNLNHIGNLVPELAAQDKAPWVFPKGVNKLNVPGLVGTASPTTTRNGYASNWGPRIGFAWDVFGRQKTAIRGGYGIYYEREDNGAVDNLGFTSPFLAGSFGPGAPGSLANLPAFSILPPAGIISPDFAPVLSHFLGFVDGNGNPTTDTTQTPVFDGNSIFLIALQTPQHYVSPSVQQWNLTVQHQLPHQFVMEVGYVGSKGTHLRETRTTIQPFIVSADHPITLTAPDGTPFTITENTVANAPARSRVLGLGPAGMQFFGNDADSHYHSLQATLSRRMKQLYVQAAYTYSKSMDDNSSDNTSFNTAVNDQTDLRASRGLSDFDRTHRLVVTYTYDLPFFQHASGFSRTALGGWQVSGFTTFQSGRPFSVVDSAGATCFTPIGPDQSLASLAPGATLADGLTHGSIESRLDHYLNQSAFAPAPAIGSDGCTGYGNMRRNVYRGPAQQNWDFAAGKTFNLTDTQKLDFRSEFFNLWNHPSFNNPTFFDVSGPNFGAIQSTVGTPRVIQFTLRYSF
jgi:carboxypeptidase family protein